MLITYIIGGMGSGKSTVAELFKEQGALTLDLDLLGHEVLQTDETKQALREAFGSEVINDQGEVDRKELGRRAFRIKESTDLLNSITTGRIMKLFSDRVEQLKQQHPDAQILIVEVSAYDGPQGEFAALADMVVAVIAPEELRIKRASTQGFTEEDVKHRLSRQPSDDERLSWADFIILNEGDQEELAQQVEDIWERLSYLCDKG